MSNFLIENNVGLAIDKLGFLKEDKEDFDDLEDYINHCEYVVSEVIEHLQEAMQLIKDKENVVNE